MLAALRASRDSLILNMVGFGEGAIILSGILSAELRFAAYKERHVAEAERLQLEDMAMKLERVILINPHSYPLKSYIPMLREYVPEICCIVPQPCTQVIVVGSTLDALSKLSAQFHENIFGSIIEYIKLPGPAYRTLPKSPLAPLPVIEGD